MLRIFKVFKLYRYINISALDFHLASTHTLIFRCDKWKIENSKENYEQLLSDILTKTRWIDSGNVMFRTQKYCTILYKCIDSELLAFRDCVKKWLEFSIRNSGWASLGNILTLHCKQTEWKFLQSHIWNLLLEFNCKILFPRKFRC